LALTSPTGGGRSVGIVRSRTKATEYEALKANVNGKVLQVPVLSILKIKTWAAAFSGLAKFDLLQQCFSIDRLRNRVKTNCVRKLNC